MTAGALLVQIARRPASEQVSQQSRATTGSAAGGAGPDGKPQGGGPNGPDPESSADTFLRRLRERGL